MVSASQIRDLIRSYLSGSLSLQRFADAFEDIYSSINVAGESDALALADHIQVLLSRVSSKLASENDLQGWLRSLSQPFNPDSASVQLDSAPFTAYNHDESYLISAPSF
jgi:hypothetical protein